MKGLRTSSFSRWLLLLLALNLAARLPLCWDPANVSPDGAEYLAIARSLRTAGQYAADLKWQFFTDEPVQHLAWADRPPLYPAFAAICATALPFVHPATAGRLGNVLLAGLALMLGVLYLRRVFNERVALVAAGYVFLLPHTLFWTTQPLTESLSLTLSLAALLAWAGASPSGNHSVARALVVGLLAGLAYLTRPTGVLLLLVFLLDVARQHRGPRATPGADARNAGSPFVAASWLLAGFLLFAVPYHVLLWKLYGSPFHSALGYTFSVASVHDVTVNGFEREHPGTLQFLRQHATEVPGWVLRQALAHAQGLLLPLLGLLPFALRMRATDWTGPRWAAGALVVTTLLVHTAAWSAKGSSRYFLLLLLVLAAALLWAGERARAGEVITRAGNTWRGRRWTMLSVALPLASCVALGVTLVQFYSTQSRPDRGIAALPAWRAAGRELRGGGLVASNNPWIVNLLAETPAVMLPRTTDAHQLERFIERYRPEVLVLFIESPADAGMRDAWRAGRVPSDWELAGDTGSMLKLIPRAGPTARGDRSTGGSSIRLPVRPGDR